MLNILDLMDSNPDEAGDNFKNKLEKLRRYYKSIVPTLNTISKKLTPYISFEEPDDGDLKNLVGTIADLEYFENGYEKIYPEQIRSAWKVIHSLIQGDSQEHVTGLTQLGKNGLITILLDFLGVVAAANPDNPQNLVPVAWLPNAVNMEYQSIRKFNESMKLNSIIKFKSPGKSFALGQFHQTMVDYIKPKVKEIIDDGNETLSKKTSLKDCIDDFFGKDCTSALVLRRSTAKFKMYKWLFEGADKTKGAIKIVLIMDESHIAIGANQNAVRTFDEKLLSHESEDDTEEEDIEADLNAEIQDEIRDAREMVTTFEKISNDQAKLVTISATNAPFSKLKYQAGKLPIYLEIGSHYCGFPFVDGKDYPCAGVSIQRPIVKSMSQFADELGNPELKLLNLKVIDSPEGYGKYWMDEDWKIIANILNNEKGFGLIESETGRGIGRIARIIEDLKNSKAKENVSVLEKIVSKCYMAKILEEQQFKRLFSRKTIKDRKTYLQSLSTEGSSLYNGWKIAVKKAQQNLGELIEYLLIKKNPSNKKGCILRWECSNKSFNEFIKPLEKRFASKIFLYPYMDSNARNTVAEILQSNHNSLPYLIVVTGRGRYGESYPPDCGYAIDATTKNSTSASFAQSLLGRLTGYKKYNPADPENTRPLLILSDFAFKNVYEPWVLHKGNPPKILIAEHMKKMDNQSKEFEFVRINRLFPELEEMFKGLDNRCNLKQKNRSWTSIKEDLFKNYILPLISNLESNPKKYVDDYPLDGPETIEILKPGETDQEGRELDWWKRNKKKNEKRKDSFLTFFAFENYIDDKTRRFGLKSSRNDKTGKEYLHTGLLVSNDNKARSIFLWLKKPVSFLSPEEQLKEYQSKEGTLPHKLSS